MSLKSSRHTRCRKCGTTEHLTSHHIFPRRNYGEGIRCVLCRQCHNKLEMIIGLAEKSITGNSKRKCRQFYMDILLLFLTEEDDSWFGSL